MADKSDKSNKLSKYKSKRNFSVTQEPEGKEEIASEELRFVVQHHMARREHYDFRLEWEGTLLSWAVPKGPSYNPKDKRLAVQVEDHPLDYRNFEGTIPKGEYGGGTVMLWDEGTWEPQEDVKQGLTEGSLKMVIRGSRIKGKWALVRLKSDKDDNKVNWLLLKEKDENAKKEAGIDTYTTSIRTARTMDEIASCEEATETNDANESTGPNESEVTIKSKSDKSGFSDSKTTLSESGSKRSKSNSQIKSSNHISATNPFQSTDIQLAKLVTNIPRGENWLYELKYDGYRIVAYVEKGKVRLDTRNGIDYTDHFQAVASSLINWADERSIILDGEMVVVDERGKTDFQALQNYMKSPSSQKLTYIVFDLLALDGADLREEPLIKRKEKLKELMNNAPRNLHYSKHVEGKGEQSLQIACQSGMEGIVGKRANSTYSGSRNGDWIKIKCDYRQEFVIGGYTLSDKKTEGLSSLLLGVYDGNQLIHVGRAGTGFSQREIDVLVSKLEKLTRKQSPFENPPAEKSDETITWLQPKLVAEVKFAEWTKENLLRQASYKGLRVDKNPKDVVREQI